MATASAPSSRLARRLTHIHFLGIGIPSPTSIPTPALPPGPGPPPRPRVPVPRPSRSPALGPRRARSTEKVGSSCSSG